MAAGSQTARPGLDPEPSALARRAFTMLEMVVVAILVMALVSTITSTMVAMPHWFGRLESKAYKMNDLPREDQVAQLSVMSDFRRVDQEGTCTCAAADRLQLASSNGVTTTHYYAVPTAGVTDSYDLTRSVTVTPAAPVVTPVATGLKMLACTDQVTYSGVDVCMVWEKDGKRRRSVMRLRKIPKPATGAIEVWEVALGDLNGDGINDLVHLRSAVSEVVVSLGSAAGTFAFYKATPLAAEPRSLALADLDRDGKLDVVAVTKDGIEVFRGSGTGGLSAIPPITGLPPSLMGVAIANFDPTVATGPELGNGIPDLLVGSSTQGNVALLTGKGDATFKAPVQIAVTNPVRDLEVADMNRDGRPDVVVGYNAGSVGVLRSGRAGGFTLVDYAACGESYSVSVGDANRDGIPDVASADKTGNRFCLQLGTSAGALGTPTSFATTKSPWQVGFLNRGNDGFLDLAVLARDTAGASEVILYSGQSASPFLGSPVATALVKSSARGLVTGNVSRDSRDDWVAGCASPDGVEIGLADANTVDFVPERQSFGAGPTSITVGPGNDVNITGGNFVVRGVRPGDILELNDANNGSRKKRFTVQSVPDADTVTVENLDWDGAGGDAALAAGPHTNVRISTELFRFTTNATVTLETGSHLGLAVATADMNRDGLLDIVKTVDRVGGSADTDWIQSWLQVADGTFSKFGGSSGIGYRPVHIGMGDLDRDGIVDCAMPLAKNDDRVSAVAGTSGGGFGAPDDTEYLELADPEGIAIADWNRDGFPDAVVGCTAASPKKTVLLLLGDGALLFTLENPPYELSDATDVPRGMAAGDLDSDGWPDVAVAVNPAAAGDELMVWRGTSPNTLSGPNKFSMNGGAVSVALGDFNRDGKLDVVTASTSGKKLTVRLGKGGADFDLPVPAAGYDLPPLALTLEPVVVKAHDMNRDGWLDLVVACKGPTAKPWDSKVGILYGKRNGTGGFDEMLTCPIYAAPQDIAIGDFNRDGKPDVVVTFAQKLYALVIYGQ
jgi:hypothetical protein